MRAISPKTLKKTKEYVMENKVTTKESLTKVLRYMSKEKYYKRFNRLFKEYIDPKNKDKNAFYYKLLQHLTDAGLTKQEAEEFFKDMRVKNAPLIQQIEESQAKIKESADKFDKARFDLLTNPVNVKSYLIMFMETAKIIEQTLNKVEKEFMLNVRNKEHFQEKIKEIKELLEEPKRELEEKLKKEAGFNEVLMLQQMKTTFDKIGDKLGEIGAELTTERAINEVLNDNIDKEQGQGQQGKEKEDNPQAPAATETERKESPEKVDILIDNDTAPTETESTQNMTLEQALENSLHATLNSVNTELDEKTLSFLTLSEYLHAYNNHNLSDVYKHFDKIFDKDEFKAIVLYNTALQNNDVDDLFDFSVEQGFEAVNIGEYAKILKHNFNEYKELDAKIEKELTLDKEEKELEIGAPQKNKKFSTIDIG